MLATTSGFDWASWLRIEAARSMPFSRASAASSTARWGTETSRMRSERSSTEPSSQPDSGKRVPSEWNTQYESRASESGREVVSVLDGGVSQGDGGVDVSGGSSDFESEPAFGLALDGVCGHELGFDDDGGAAGRGDEYVGLETGAVDDLLGVLEVNGVLGQHTSKQRTEGVVGVLLGLLGHWDGSWGWGCLDYTARLGGGGFTTAPPLWIPAFAGMTGWAEGDFRFLDSAALRSESLWPCEGHVRG